MLHIWRGYFDTYWSIYDTLNNVAESITQIFGYTPFVFGHMVSDFRTMCDPFIPEKSALSYSIAGGRWAPIYTIELPKNICVMHDTYGWRQITQPNCMTKSRQRGEQYIVMSLIGQLKLNLNIPELNWLEIVHSNKFKGNWLDSDPNIWIQPIKPNHSIFSRIVGRYFTCFYGVLTGCMLLTTINRENKDRLVLGCIRRVLSRKLCGHSLEDSRERNIG